MASVDSEACEDTPERRSRMRSAGQRSTVGPVQAPDASSDAATAPPHEEPTRTSNCPAEEMAVSCTAMQDARESSMARRSHCHGQRVNMEIGDSRLRMTLLRALGSHRDISMSGAVTRSPCSRMPLTLCPLGPDSRPWQKRTWIWRVIFCTNPVLQRRAILHRRRPSSSAADARSARASRRPGAVARTLLARRAGVVFSRILGCLRTRS